MNSVLETSTISVTLPEMGESVTEGSIVEWRRKPGEFVAEGDPLVEVTTDKVDVEVPATASGVLTQILAHEGDTVAVGAVLAEIDTSKKDGAPAAAPSTGNGAAKAAAPKPQAPPPPPPGRGEPVADYQAERAAQRLDVDLARVRGSGPNGLILRSDVLAAAETARRRPAGPAPLPAPPVPPGATVTPLRGPAAALTGYMEQSLSIPTATSFRGIAVDVLDARRKELNGAVKAAGRNERISFTHLIAYALVLAAREMPFITYSFRRDEDGKPARLEPGIHLGLAVDSERKDGSRFLVVPVIRDAGSLDFAAFRAKYEDLVAAARENRLTADDLQGASFTLTNPGGIGTAASVPRLMAGQGAILATGAIGYPAGFGAANEQSLRLLGVSRVMQITSTYDHRVIQGAQSGEYLRRVDELLQGADAFYETVFSSLGLQAAPVPQVALATVGTGETKPSDEMLRAVAAGMAIVSAYRRHGHLAANLDPLGAEPVGDPSLEPQTYGLTPALQSAIPASVLRVKVPGTTLAEVLPRLRETYSSTIAYEIEHISNANERVWLRDYIESGRNKVKHSPQRQIEFLSRLTRVEAFDRYVRKAFLGQKTFSGEGLDVMVPMLEEMLDMLADDGVARAVLGMAHRGRLNVIAHVVNAPYEEVMTEFEAAQYRGQLGDDDVMGDVKYHHGSTGTFTTSKGKMIDVTLAHNPSHLEAVDPVVEGSARALQTDHSRGIPERDAKRAVPILIHGDAAFTGQGIVSEVFNMQSLPGYETGGTLHLIANNQVGFTTDPNDARSTRYASDLAKGFDVPIVHVNADDVDACIAAVHLAVDFRRAFGRDTLIDLIGYRRFGHNEQDEPAYTQPQMAERIKNHPTVRELFANKLVNQGIITPEQSQAMIDEATERLQEARRAVKGALASHITGRKLSGSNTFDGTVLPQVDRTRLVAWSDELVAVPQGFALNRKLRAQFDRRAATVSRERDRRLGNGRSAGICVAIDDRNSDPSHRPRYRAGDVQPSPCRLSRRRRAQRLDSASAHRRAPGVVRNPKQPALRVRLRGIRVWILHPAIGSARSVGGAVRRLLQRCADNRRSVHRRGASEVGTDLSANAASPSRLRRCRPGTLQRASGALSAARRGRQPARRRAVGSKQLLSLAADAGALADRRAASRLDSEVVAARRERRRTSRRDGGGLVCAGDRRPARGRSRAHRALDPVQRQDLSRSGRARVVRFAAAHGDRAHRAARAAAGR